MDGMEKSGANRPGIFQTSQASQAGGVVVTGYDLRNPLDDAGRAELQSLLDEHHLLIFPGQELAPEDQVRTLSTFGRVCDENADGIFHTYVSNTRPDGLLGTRGLPYHCDFSFTQHQPQVLSLYGAEIKGEPEPTTFVNPVRAQATLPDDVRARFEQFTVVHAHDYSVDGGTRADHGRPALLDYADMPPYATHPRASFPLLRLHPRTGKKILNVTQFHTSHIEGMSRDESEAIVQDLFARLYRPANMYSHYWKQNDLVIWDNYAIQHGRQPFEGQARAATRTLCRVVVSEKSVVEIMDGVIYNSTGGFKVPKMG